MKKLLLVLLLLCTFSLAACNNNNGPQTIKGSIYITGKRALAVGKSTTLVANKDVTWTSSDEAVATVTEDGLVTAVEFGDVTITATGVENLVGAPVYVTDLRAGAALIIAGVSAKGVTEIHNLEHIDRGYENIEEKFRNIGADIKRVSE